MSNFATLLEEIEDKEREKIRNINLDFAEVNAFFMRLNHMKKHKAIYDKTGKYVPFKRDQSATEVDSESSVVNENEAPVPQKEEKRATRGRVRKAGLTDATNTITEESSLQPKDLFKIKKEKISDVGIAPLKLDNVEIKQEKEDMPAPTQLPRKRKKIKTEVEETKPQTTRVTRTKTRNKQEKQDESSSTNDTRKDSDIILQPEIIPTIDLSDDEKSDSTKNATSTRSTRTKTRNDKKKAQDEGTSVVIPETRSTRTKTKNKPQQEQPAKTKRSRGEDELERETKKSRSNSAGSTKTEYEDAVSTLDNNTTYAVAKSPNPRATVTLETEVLNSTVVVEKPKVLHNEKVVKAPVFNPFEQSPVKKKVEAFEKLNSQISAKSKMVTPVNNKSIPKAYNSTTRANKVLSANCNDTLNNKSLSALKASQAEYREREKRREMEALKKREAFLQAQTEEKRKKREEKHQKAQEQREVIQKEKMKLIEQQRLKDERTKQLIAEKEEKLQKQREEQEKKRLLAKEKALKQMKEKQEALEQQQKLLKQQQQQQHQQQQLPIYMTTKPPQLPTYDCYDSDDENYKKNKAMVPAWSVGSQIRDMQQVMHCVGERLKNTFFCMKPQTADLREIFELIDPKKLKRTSSAIWRKPPRYTLMPIDDQPEFLEEDFDELDED